MGISQLLVKMCVRLHLLFLTSSYFPIGCHFNHPHHGCQRFNLRFLRSFETSDYTDYDRLHRCEML